MTDLVQVLAEAQQAGFLGPGPVTAHIDHAAVFAVGLDVAPTRALDLGSGGGVPGLVLALDWPASSWVLLDAAERRAAFLEGAVRSLELGDRVEVVRGRAEEAGRTPDLRGRFDLVVARSFGPPAVTAECGAPFLRIGGVLRVSEPPEATDRWPAGGLALLGLEPGPQVTGSRGHVQELRQVEPCPDRFPRRTGRPAKSPLFS